MQKKTIMVARPGKDKNDHLRKAGNEPRYSKDPITGLTRSRFHCQCHGYEFETVAIRRVHLQAYKNSMQKDFAELVRTGNLGQSAWERLPGEPPLQFSRFQVYLHRTPDPKTGNRSITRCAAIASVDANMLHKVAKKWNWTMRADMWDRHIEREELQAFEKEKRESAQRQARLGKKLQEVAHAGASALLMDDARVSEMTGNEIAKLADVGTKIERLANQDPTAISEDRGQVRLVWEGPKPTWAPEPEPKGSVIDAGPLTRRVGSGSA